MSRRTTIKRYIEKAKERLEVHRAEMERLTKLHNDAEEEQKRLAQLQDQCVRNLLTLQGKVEEINLLLNETEEEPVVEDYEDETIVEYPEENFPTSFGEGEDIPGMNEVVE